MASGELEIVGQTGPKFEAPADQVVWVLSDDEDGVRPPPRKRPRVAASTAGGNSAGITVARATAGPSAATRQAEPVVVEEIADTNGRESAARPGRSAPTQSVPVPERTPRTMPDESHGTTATSQEDARPSEVETVHVLRRRRPQPVEAAGNNDEGSDRRGALAAVAAGLDAAIADEAAMWAETASIGRWEPVILPWEDTGDHPDGYSFGTPHPEEAEEVGRISREASRTPLWELGGRYRAVRRGRGQTRTTRDSHPELSRRLRNLHQSQNVPPNWMANGPTQLETRIRQHGNASHRNLQDMIFSGLLGHQVSEMPDEITSNPYAEPPAGDDYERNLRLDERVPSRRGATRDAIRAVKSAKIKAEDVGETCCICLAQFAKHGSGKRLPCSHLFHSRCIDRWLKVKGECPLCKQRIDIPQNYEKR